MKVYLVYSFLNSMEQKKYFADQSFVNHGFENEIYIFFKFLF